jgi:hypothetical protein
MFGIQVVALSADQKELLKKYPNLRYHHFIAQDAILPSGQINLREAKFLGQLVDDLKVPGPIIEIGTLFGWSTRVILLFIDNERKLISVDNYSWNPFNFPSDIHYNITSSILSDAISSGVLELVRLDNSEFYKQYDGTAPALFFIDGDHEYEAVKTDIQGAMKLNAATICGHDYDIARCPGVVKAVNEFGGPKKIVDSLWVL